MPSPLCAYANAFGEPDKGVHKYRVGGFALVDTLATVLVAVLITWFLHKRCSTLSSEVLVFLQVFVWLVVVGEIMHLLFCVDTAGVRALHALDALHVY
jgi:hypothetical protein